VLKRTKGVATFLEELTRIFLLRHELHASWVPIRCRFKGSSLEDRGVEEDPDGCELGGEFSFGGTGSSWRYLLDIAWTRVTGKGSVEDSK
jgi:hypothetical protein